MNRLASCKDSSRNLISFASPARGVFTPDQWNHPCPVKFVQLHFLKAMICAMPELFHRLARNVFAIFNGRNLLWHALAILLTIVIVMSGFDWTYFRWTRGDTFARLARPAIVIGTFPATHRDFDSPAGRRGREMPLCAHDCLGFGAGCAARLFNFMRLQGVHRTTAAAVPRFRMSAMNEGSPVDSN
jgi:hypothetical protein